MAAQWSATSTRTRPLEVGDANVLLDVATPTLTEAIAPSAYVVEVWRNGAFEQAVQVPSLPARFSNLVNGDSYSFVLQGVSAAGASPPSPPTEVVTPLELPPFSTAENLVDQVFSGFHGRSPTATELQSWSMRARGPGEILDVVEELANEPAVELRRRITRLYLGFYGRSPDVGGLRFWSDRAAAGESLERIALQFATASEFEQGREIDDRTFVTAAYERVLGRLPDQNGLIYWERELGSGLDRGRLLVLFSESPEHVAKTGAKSEITIAFDALLSRLPTAAELSRWEPVVRADGVRPLLQAILDDSEFQAA